MVLASGTAVAQALPVLFTPLLSRLFTAEAFGELGLFTSFVAVGATIVSLSFPLAIVSGPTSRVAAMLTILGLLVTVPMATVLTLFLWYLRTNDGVGFGAVPVISIPAAWCVLVLIGAFTSLRYWLVRETAFEVISRATVGQSVGRVAAQLATGVAAMSGAGLILAEVVGRTVGLWTLISRCFRDIVREIKGVSRADYIATASEFRKFPLLSTPSSVLDSLSTALPIPLLTTYFGLSAAGQFSMAYRTLALPIALIGAAVADSFHAEIARTARADIRTSRNLFFRVAILLFGLGIVPSFMVLLFGHTIFRLVLGAQWEQAGVLASAIIPWLLASFVVSPLSRVVLVFRGQELKLIFDGLSILGVIGAIVLGASQDWPLERTARLLGASQAVAYLIYFGLLWRILNDQIAQHPAQNE